MDVSLTHRSLSDQLDAGQRSLEDRGEHSNPVFDVTWHLQRSLNRGQ
jgi:hypothetical protein